MTQEHGVAGGSDHHADHGQPDVAQSLRGVSAVPDTQHVAHGHKQGVGVLDVPSRILQKVQKKKQPTRRR